MNLILPSLLALTALTLAWFRFERSWDRRLFAPEPGRICANVRSQAAAELLRTQGGLQVLDVRSKNEFAGGALPGATNVPLGDKDFRTRVGELDRLKPVLVYCAGGFSSRKAVEVLRALGFQAVYHLHRGYYSWQMAGLPIAKEATRVE